MDVLERGVETWMSVFVQRRGVGVRRVVHRACGNGKDDAIQHKSTVAVQDADFATAAKIKFRTVLLGTQKLRYRRV